MKTKHIYLICINIIIALGIFQYGLINIHHSKFLNIIDDILILILFSHLLLNKILKHNLTSKDITAYGGIYVLIIIFSIITSVLNNVPVLIFIQGMKSYFLYILFFYCIYWLNLNEKEITNIIDFILKLMIIELIISLVQLYLALTGHQLTKLIVDSAQGSFGAANIMGYFMFILVYYTFCQFFYNNKKGYLLYFAISLILLIISSARFAILIIMPIILLLNIKKSVKLLLKSSLIISLIGIVVLAYFIGSVSYISGDQENMFGFYDFSKLIHHFEITENSVDSGSGRNLWYPLTWNLLNEYSISPYIGFGIGMYASSTAFEYMPNTNKRIDNYFHQEEKGLDTLVDSQIIPLLGEIGIIGLTFVYIFLLFAFIRCLSLVIKVEGFPNIISGTAAAYVLFFIFGFYIHHMLEYAPTSMMLFLFLAFTETLINSSKVEKK